MSIHVYTMYIYQYTSKLTYIHVRMERASLRIKVVVRDIRVCVCSLVGQSRGLRATLKREKYSVFYMVNYKIGGFDLN